VEGEFNSSPFFFKKLCRYLLQQAQETLTLYQEKLLVVQKCIVLIKSEAKNKVILTDSTATFTELDYYYQYSTTQALVENNYYLVTITNTTDGIVIFKDKMYCTDQTLSDYEISNGVYIEQSTGNNEFVYYG